MGVIRPPWITKEWFAQCPFNYCDHFGNKEELAKICKICRDEIQRLAEYKERGEDPYAWENVFKEVSKSFAETMVLVHKHAEEMGIDLNNLDDVPDRAEVDKEHNPVFIAAEKYGARIEKVIKTLEAVPIDADVELITKAVNALSHSRFYVIAKIGRAISSQAEEQRDPEDDLFDSKTSALFAYVAAERNSRILLALAKHKPLMQLRKKYLSLAKTSIQLCEMIQAEFFPQDKLIYEEFGCDEYNTLEIDERI